MRRRLYCALAFALLFSACLAAQNVFVLPPASSSNVAVFSADPFAQTAVLNVTSSGILVLAAPNNKFYIISNVGNGNPTVAAVTQNADGTFSAVKNVSSFIGALAAAISPNGRWLTNTRTTRTVSGPSGRARGACSSASPRTGTGALARRTSSQQPAKTSGRKRLI